MKELQSELRREQALISIKSELQSELRRAQAIYNCACKGYNELVPAGLEILQGKLSTLIDKVERLEKEL